MEISSGINCHDIGKSTSSVNGKFPFLTTEGHGMILHFFIRGVNMRNKTGSRLV